MAGLAQRLNRYARKSRAYYAAHDAGTDDAPETVQ
jgi:hypothetical protein